MTLAQKTAVVVVALLLSVGVNSSSAGSTNPSGAKVMAFVGVVDNRIVNDDPVVAKQEADLDKATGFNSVEAIVPWIPGEGSIIASYLPGVCDAAKAVRSDGMTFFMRLEPQDASGNPGNPPVTPPDIQNYVATAVAFVSALASPACAGLTTIYIGIANEPNLARFWPQMAGGQWVAPQQYAQLLNAVYPALKAVGAQLNVQVNVIAGELASSHHTLAFIAAMGKVQMDIFAWHPYGSNSSDGPANTHPNGNIVGLSDFPQLTSALQASLGYVPPIIASEFGVQTTVPSAMIGVGLPYTGPSPASSGAVTESQQAVFGIQALSLAAYDKLVGFFWFHLFDDPTPATGWTSGLYYSSTWPAAPVAKSSQPAFHLALCAITGC